MRNGLSTRGGMLRRWAQIALIALSGTGPAWGAGAPPPEDGKPPSIILISIDTLRADRLGCYGYKRIRTPHIDALTAGGTQFQAIESPVPLTFPAHVSLFTSTYPFFNGIEDNGEALSSKFVTLAAVLKSHGYQTAAVVGGFVLDRRFGLNKGFDHYDSTFNVHHEQSSDPGDIKRLGADVVVTATNWLKGNSHQPFFLFVHLYDLHTPYNLPATYRSRFGSSYDGELQYIDEQVGVLCDYLRKSGLFDKSLVVLTSDHGESLGEHGEKNHGYFIYQSSMWLPLIMHWPAGSGAQPAQVAEPASLMDVAPTILQFVGIPPPPEFQGRSLLELLHVASPNPEREIYSESLYAHNHFGCSSLRSLRVGRYKYIQAPKPELYDLAADPHETTNIYTQHQSLGLASGERLAGLRSRFRADHPGAAKALDPETVARLGSLGYVALSSQHSDSPESGADPKDRIADFESYGQAIGLAATGQVSESNALLSHLLELHPELFDLRMNLGLNDQRQQMPDAAAREFQQVLKADPLNIQAHFNLGLSFFELHQMEGAEKELQAALAIAPYYTHAQQLLGTIMLQQGDYIHAREQFAHILIIDPNDYGAHYNLGALAMLEGDWAAGEQHLEAALGIDPNDADAHNLLGSLYLRKGDLDKAALELRQAIRLRPQFAGAHFNLGLVFEKQHRDEEAAREYRQALAADPQFGPARDALQKAERASGH